MKPNFFHALGRCRRKTRPRECCNVSVRIHVCVYASVYVCVFVCVVCVGLGVESILLINNKAPYTHGRRESGVVLAISRGLGRGWFCDSYLLVSYPFAPPCYNKGTAVDAYYKTNKIMKEYRNINFISLSLSLSRRMKHKNINFNPVTNIFLFLTNSRTI